MKMERWGEKVTVQNDYQARQQLVCCGMGGKREKKMKFSWVSCLQNCMNGSTTYSYVYVIYVCMCVYVSFVCLSLQKNQVLMYKGGESIKSLDLGSCCCGTMEMNPTSIHEDAGLNPGLTEWVGDPELL